MASLLLVVQQVLVALLTELGLVRHQLNIPEILLPELPGFLYFREEASPHLLPILFEVNSLKEQLRLRVMDLEIQKEVDSSKSKT